MTIEPGPMHFQNSQESSKDREGDSGQRGLGLRSTLLTTQYSSWALLAQTTTVPYVHAQPLQHTRVRAHTHPFSLLLGAD